MLTASPVVQESMFPRVLVTDQVDDLCSFSCPLCTDPAYRNVCTFPGLRLHLRQRHGIKNAQLECFATVWTLHQCLLCRRRVPCTRDDIKAHLKSCREGMTLEKYEALRRRGREEKEDAEAAFELEEGCLFLCPRCPMQAESWRDLHGHVKKNHDMGDFASK